MPTVTELAEHTIPMTPPSLKSRSLLTRSSPPQETDISDSPRILRKHSSLGIPSNRLGISSSQPDLLRKGIITQNVSPSPSPPPASSVTGLDITENETDKLVLNPQDMAQFRKWVIGFCVVNFDLEIGQALDYVYPSMDLTLSEQKNICFSAFPDSNVFEVGDQVYNVRVRAGNSGFAVSGPTTSAGFLYGYVFFRQKKDRTIRRGYFQKSLVLLSQHPYVGLFSRIVAILGPIFFETGQPALEAACMNIAHWDPPVDGQTHDLSFLGHLLQVEIPQLYKPQLLETSPFDMNQLEPDLQIMASLPVGGLYHHFKDILPDLWLLWELILLAEPVVVIAPDPGICSEAVVSMVDLINPIPYCGDYRPYFTIQDTDFKYFVTKNKPACNLILGVTNPYFNTAVEHWPHIVRVGRQQLRKPDGTLITAHGNHVYPRKSKPALGSKSNVLFDFVQGITSKRKAVISKDRELLRMLTEATVRGHPPDWVLNNILRRHFVDLTEKFLVPLNRYFSTLIPVNMSFTSDIKPPRLRPFQTDQFMKSLKEHGPQLPFKSTFKTRTSTTDPTKELYSQFLKCGNFATWLQLRTTEAQAEMNRLYVKALCEVDPARSSADLKLRIQEVLYPSAASCLDLANAMTDKQRERLHERCMPTFSAKISRVRSVRLSSFRKRSPSPPSTPQPTTSSSLTRTENNNNYNNMPHSRTRTVSSPTANSFVETLRVISKEAQSGRFNDVFDAFFFTDKRCQNRAFFMAARLKQTLQPFLTQHNDLDGLWKLVTHRLYTFNYLLFVMSSTCHVRSRFLAALEEELGRLGDGQNVHRRGGMEAHFAVRYALLRKRRRRTLLEMQDIDDPTDALVERARVVLEHCLRSEAKLGHAERDAMYVFHGMRVGLHGSFEPRIELEEDQELRRLLRQAVMENKELAKPAYENPFEDASCIVKDDEEDAIPTTSSREVDSGFYEGITS
ncbi:Protein dennd6a [Apophysomyces ossiformis]|uniref:Protein dennd6a n=1 Tax=Apophysomyces ossiformis TaxID=679940 RepID=A0A8H7EQR4_9FUNG|nr:Protein dennd6a [Apophysomyces ossiformis]